MFRLVSGVESNVYFNMKPTMFDPEGAALMARLVVERLAAAGVTAVGGLEMGAVPIVAAATVQSQLAGRPIQGFFVRKKAKEHGAKLRIEGLAAGESLQAKRVAIIDDVCTTGGSALSAIDEVRAEGGEIVLVLAIVDRRRRAPSGSCATHGNSPSTRSTARTSSSPRASSACRRRSAERRGFTAALRGVTTARGIAR